MSIIIETDRLLLRTLTLNDIDGMFELDTNPEVHQYLGKQPITSKKEAQITIEQILSQYKMYGIGRWAAIEKTSGDFIGWSGLRMNTEKIMNGYYNFYDIGYRFIPRYWGKGYATESGKAAINYGFNQLNISTIYGISELGNKASKKALLNIGLTYIEDFMYEPENIKLSWYKIDNPK